MIIMMMMMTPVDSDWPLYDLQPQHSTSIWSGILHTKFGSHRALLNNALPLFSPIEYCTMFDPSIYITLWSGVLYTKSSGHRTFVKQRYLPMTFELLWSCFKNMLSNLVDPSPIPTPSFSSILYLKARRNVFRGKTTTVLTLRRLNCMHFAHRQ